MYIKCQNLVRKLFFLLILIFFVNNFVLADVSIDVDEIVGFESSILIKGIDYWEEYYIRLYDYDNGVNSDILNLKDVCIDEEVCLLKFNDISGYESLGNNVILKLKKKVEQTILEKEINFDVTPLFENSFDYSFYIDSNQLVIEFNIEDENDLEEYVEMKNSINLDNYVLIKKNMDIIDKEVYLNSNKLIVKFSSTQTLDFLEKKNVFDFVFQDKFKNEKTKEVRIDLTKDFSVNLLYEKDLNLKNNVLSYEIGSLSNEIGDIKEFTLRMKNCGVNVGASSSSNNLKVRSDGYYAINFSFNLFEEFKTKESCEYVIIATTSSNFDYEIKSGYFNLDKISPVFDKVLLNKFSNEKKLDNIKSELENALDINKKELKFQYNVTANEEINKFDFDSECLTLLSDESIIKGNSLFFNVTLSDSYFKLKDNNFNYIESYKSCDTNITIYDNSLNNKEKKIDFMEEYFVDFSPDYEINEITAGSVDKINQEIIVNISSTNSSNYFKESFLITPLNEIIDLDYSKSSNIIYNEYLWNISKDSVYSIVLANVTAEKIDKEIEIDISKPNIINQGFKGGNSICKNENEVLFTVVSDKRIKSFTFNTSSLYKKTIECLEYTKSCSKEIVLNNDDDEIKYDLIVTDVNDVNVSKLNQKIQRDNKLPTIADVSKVYLVNNGIFDLTINDSNEINKNDISFESDKIIVTECKYDQWNSQTTCKINVSEYLPTKTYLNLTVKSIKDKCDNQNTTVQKIKILRDISPPIITNKYGEEIINSFISDGRKLYLNIGEEETGSIYNGDIKRTESFFKFNLYFLESLTSDYIVNITIDKLKSETSHENIILNSKSGCTLLENSIAFKEMHNGNSLIKCSDSIRVEGLSPGENKTINISIIDFGGNTIFKQQNYSILEVESLNYDYINNVKETKIIPDQLPASLLNVVGNYPFTFSIQLEKLNEDSVFDFDIASYKLDNCEFYHNGVVFEDVYDEDFHTEKYYKEDGKIIIDNTLYLNFTNQFNYVDIENITMDCNYTFNYMFYDNGIKKIDPISKDIRYNYTIDLFSLPLPGEQILTTIYDDICNNNFHKVEAALYETSKIVELGQSVCGIKDEIALLSENVFEPAIDMLSAIEAILKIFSFSPAIESAVKSIDGVIESIDIVNENFVNSVMDIYSNNNINGICNFLTCENAETMNKNKNYLSFLYTGVDSEDLPTTEESLVMSLSSVCLPSIYSHYLQIFDPECAYGLCILDELDMGSSNLGYNCKLEKDYKTCTYWGKQSIYSSPLYGLVSYLNQVVSTLFSSDILSELTLKINDFSANALCSILPSSNNWLISFFGCQNIDSRTDYIKFGNEDGSKFLYSAMNYTQKTVKALNALNILDYIEGAQSSDGNFFDNIWDVFLDQTVDWVNRVLSSLTLFSNYDVMLKDEDINFDWYANSEDDGNNCKYFFNNKFSNVTILGIEYDDLPSSIKNKYGLESNLTVCDYLNELYGDDD